MSPASPYTEVVLGWLPAGLSRTHNIVLLPISELFIITPAVWCEPTYWICIDKSKLKVNKKHWIFHFPVIYSRTRQFSHVTRILLPDLCHSVTMHLMIPVALSWLKMTGSVETGDSEETTVHTHRHTHDSVRSLLPSREAARRADLFCSASRNARRSKPNSSEIPCAVCALWENVHSPQDVCFYRLI